MGKRIALRRNTSPCKMESPQPYLEHQKSTNFSLTEKNYLEFFEFLKELHLTPSTAKPPQEAHQNSLNLITSSLLYFFNQTKAYTSRQLECSTICLANLFGVLGSNLTQLTLGRQFVLKLRRFSCELAEDTLQLGYNQKVQALLYILVMLIYKEKAGQICPIKQLNKLIWTDRALVSSLLRLKLPQDKRMSKFYGIAIVYLSNRKNNPKLKKLIVSSIFNNFQSIEHETTLLNLLVYLRNEKNKVTLNLRDIQEGRVVKLLISAYPRHIHQYHSYYILDYLHHLVALFPALAIHVASSSFIPYLIETASPTNLHHPLHQSTIISFTQSTFKYIEASHKQRLIEAITTIHPFNQFIAIKLVQMLVNHELDWSQLLNLAYKGYFDNLLEIVSKEQEQGVRKSAAEQYLKVVEKIETINEAAGSYLLSKMQNKVSRSNSPWLQMMLDNHSQSPLSVNILLM